MSDFNRRDALKIGAGAVAAGTLAGEASAQGQQQAVPTLSYRPEQGAQLRVLRGSRFVDGDQRVWDENTARFTRTTGVQIRTEYESWEDIRPKAAVAANIGRGPDIIMGWFDDPHQYPDRLADVNDLGNYLDRKYRFYDVAKRYGQRQGRWIALPLGCAGACINYRISSIREAGFESVPRDLPGFLRLMQALKRINKPGGFALGRAVGDGNGWTHWLLWAHGAKMVDEQGNVTLNSPETIAALDYAKQLYETFIPGTLTWLDINNNRAFLSGDLHLTANGISIWVSAKSSQEAAQRAIAEDMNHVNFPVGPVGRPGELHLMTQAMIMRYTRFPNAAREYIRFMYEREQIAPWVDASLGYFTPAMSAYESLPTWTSDPKVTPYRSTFNNMLWNGYSGPLSAASAAAMADYIMIDMFQEACSGSQTSAAAAQRAHRRAERFYRV